MSNIVATLYLVGLNVPEYKSGYNGQNHLKIISEIHNSLPAFAGIQMLYSRIIKGSSTVSQMGTVQLKNLCEAKKDS